MLTEDILSACSRPLTVSDQQKWMVTEKGQQHISGKAPGVWASHGWCKMLVCLLHLSGFYPQKNMPVRVTC